MADNKIAVTRTACQTTASSQNYDAPAGFGTPKGAIVIATGATADGTETAGARMSVGFFDGTNARMISVRDDDAVTTTDSLRGTGAPASEDLAKLFDEGGAGSNVDLRLRDAVFYDAGITLTRASGGDTTAYLITIIFIGGADTTCAVGDSSGGATTDPIVVSSLSFEPENLFFAACDRVFNGGSTGHWYPQLGMADNDGASPYPQGAISCVSDDAQTTSQCGGIWSNTRALLHVTTDTTATSGRVGFEVTAFSATGFTVTPRDDWSSLVAEDFCWLAVNWGGGGHWVGNVDVPTSGNISSTGPGFQPQGLIGLVTSSSETAHVEAEGSEPASIGVYAATTVNTNEFCSFMAVEDAVTTSNTKCRTDDNLRCEPGGSGAGQVFDGDIHTNGSWDATGFTININDNPTAAARAIWFALEDPNAAAVDLSYLRRYEHTPAPNTHLRM